MNNIYLSQISAAGMVAVALTALVWWLKVSGLPSRWLWTGAGLWTVAVALKLACAFALNQQVIGFLAAQHSSVLLLVAGGVYLGFQSALFEVGLAHLAVRIWPQLGSDAPRAFGIGVGAGAFEAMLLGVAIFAAGVASLTGNPAGPDIVEGINHTASTTTLFWLVPPVERTIAILGHTASRALVLLGVVHRRPRMVLGGWLMFVLVDGIAGVFHLTGKVGNISMWWLELAVLPSALISIPILRWCWRQWPQSDTLAHGLATRDWKLG